MQRWREAWIGLAGVIAGAPIALGGQHVARQSEVRERTQTFLLEQCALLVALSEDYRNRVWEERNQLAADVVAAWDLAAYRLAQARLRILCSDSDVLTAIETLRKAGTDLGRTWRLSPQDETSVQAAWEAHRSALKAFIAASSELLQAPGK
jgi:hypothetical protein